MKHYDYIIAGAGCAGLSLLVRMLASGTFSDKKILLVDRSPKKENDRTWCFWETDPGFFEPIVYRKWSRLAFHSRSQSRQLDIHPFSYKMIRGADFYAYCFRILEQHHVDVLYEDIISMQSGEGSACLGLKDRSISADYLFSSIMPAQLERQPGRQYLWQHFKGWTVLADRDCFSPEAATLMDFRISQQHGASFVYVLPFDARRAMVEYTVFSDSLLPDAAYTGMLRAYLRAAFPGVAYTITEEEQGKIPMTNHRFPRADGRIIYLGTMGGNTKPSSGYTFNFIQAHSDRLTEALIRYGHPFLKPKPFNRFQWYDSVMLRVLAEGQVPADTIFERLFCRNSPQQVLRFLDNASTIGEEMGLISSLPSLPFIRAAVHEYRGRQKHKPYAKGRQSSKQ